MTPPTFDPHCIFCKIIRGEIPAAKILETEFAVAFFDVNPVNPGHALLVPKTHHPTLAELPDAYAAHAGGLLPRLCRALVAATAAQGFNLVVNNGRVAGQTVDHGHWHVIPRSPGDAVHWPWPHGRGYAPGELAELQARVQAELAHPPEA